MMVKKTPMRMCVGCREMHEKKSLLRIVRTPDGDIIVDRTGKASGRGAYICAKEECLTRAQRIRALERALEHKIDEAVFLRLKEEIASDG